MISPDIASAIMFQPFLRNEDPDKDGDYKKYYEAEDGLFKIVQRFSPLPKEGCNE